MELRVAACLILLVRAYDCVFEAPDGVLYDLRALAHTSPPDYSIQGQGYFEYRVNVCEPVFQSCGGDFTGVATQWNPQGACVSIIGRENPEYGGLNRPTLDYINKDDPNQGVVLTYKNGDLCPSIVAFERQVTYAITCDKSTKGTIISASEPEVCSYRIEFRSKAACPPAAASSQKASKKRTNMLKLALIGAACVFALYCIIGTYLNKKNNGTNTFESIPHKEFWYSLPELLQEIVGNLYTKLRGWKDGYQAPEGSVPL